MRARKSQQEATIRVSEVCVALTESFTQIFPKISHRAVKNGEAQSDGEKKEDKPEALLIEVNYDFDSKMVKLVLKDKLALNFSVNSMLLKYNFLNKEIPKEVILENTSSYRKTYEFLADYVDRHILHPKFSGVVEFFRGDIKFQQKFSFDVPFFEVLTPLDLSFLDTSFPTNDIINIFNNEFESTNLLPAEHELLGKIKSNNLKFLERFHYSLFIEDLKQQEEYKDFILEKVVLTNEGNDMYSFKVEKKDMPPNYDELSLCLFPMNLYNRGKFVINKEDDCIFAFIEAYLKDQEMMIFKKKFPYNHFGPRRVVETDIKYAVRFVPNRVTHRACHSALKTIKEDGLKRFIKYFEDIPDKNEEEQNETPLQKFFNFQWENKNIGTNAEQSIAIKNIVNCTSFPLPFVIFGPPGTGKTSCVVECIVQILKCKPNSKILVCTQSNSASDEIGERLLGYLSIYQVFRFYSSQLLTSKESINKKLLPSSNLRNLKTHQMPKEEELKYFSVVISTLTSSSQFVRANLQNHFDYIFIDECGATSEPENYIPILGLGNDEGKITASIVLLGDHKQLPPVITADYAKHLKLDVSLMERIMNTKRYLPNPEYDNRYVTQLLDNYRSHVSILQFSNTEFYDGKLRAKSKSDDIMLGTKWNQLPNNKFPILFHPCKAPSKKANDGVSTINYAQAEIVKSYVDNLLKKGVGQRKITQDDIGVVTPYKAQKDVLKRMLPPKVEIGTSEYYQGREKLIIIFSTVKSKTGVGFLSDARRLNVCLTRAKGLMIVIGNPETLMQDELWKRFIEYCSSNRAFMGANNKPAKSKNEKKARKAVVSERKSSSSVEEADNDFNDADRVVNVPMCLSIVERLRNVNL